MPFSACRTNAVRQSLTRLHTLIDAVVPVFHVCLSGGTFVRHAPACTWRRIYAVTLPSCWMYPAVSAAAPEQRRVQLYRRWRYAWVPFTPLRELCDMRAVLRRMPVL